MAKIQTSLPDDTQPKREKDVGKKKSRFGGWRRNLLFLLLACGVCSLPGILAKPKPTLLPTLNAGDQIPTVALVMVATVTETPTPTETLVPPTSTPVPPTATNAPIVAVPIVASALPTASPTAIFIEAEYVQALVDYISIAAGGRNFISVRVVDGRVNGGERVAIIAYVTTETDAQGYLDEIVDILDAIGGAISSKKIDMDSITLIGGSSAESAEIIVAAQVADIQAYRRGEITRQTLIERLTIETLTASAAPIAAPVVRTTYYVKSSANVRPCPRTSSDCAGIQQLSTGATVVVIGQTEGENTNGSALWYQIERTVGTAYVHSSVVSMQPVAATNASAGGGVSSGENSAGGQSAATSIPNAGAVCDCSGNTLNCGDFSPRSSAQACYTYCLSNSGRDVHQLDQDEDGLACESS